MGGRWVWRVALAALVYAVPVHAQTVGDGAKTSLNGDKLSVIDRTDSTGVSLEEGDTRGSLKIGDGARDRDLDWKHLDIINATLIPGSAAASAALDTRGWGSMGLVLYVAPEDTTFIAYFAVQVRGGYTAATDSMSSFPWAGWKSGSVGTPDTLGTVYLPPDSVNTSDVAGFPTNTAVEDEFIVQVVVKGQGSSGATNHAKFIPLCRNSVWWRAPYTTVRIRPLNHRIALRAPAARLTAQNVRADLVGWR